MSKTQAPPKSNGAAPATGTAVATVDKENKLCVFKPFMASEEIQLSVAIVKNMLCVKTRSGKTCDDTQAMKFIMLCKARGLNPFEGDAYLIGYDSKDGPQFSLITAHQAFLKRAEVNPDYDGMESGVIVKTKADEVVDREGDFTFDGEDLLGGWATVYFKNKKYPMHKRLKLTTFRKGYGRWNDDPAGMIVKCAEADALRSAFPLALAGMLFEGEVGRPEEAPPRQLGQGPPPGRHRMGTPAPVRTPPPLVTDAEVDLPEPATSPEQDHDAMARQDAFDALMEDVGRCESAGDCDRVENEVDGNRLLLGDSLVGTLLEAIKTRRNDLAR